MMPPGRKPGIGPEAGDRVPVMRAMPPAPLWPIQIEPSRAPSSAETAWSAAAIPCTPVSRRANTAPSKRTSPVLVPSQR